MWMILSNALFDTSSIPFPSHNSLDPNFIWIASGELPIAILDVYIAIKVFLMKRGSSKAQKILWKLLSIITIGFAMKVATIFMFLRGHDPFWFFYLVVFPINTLMYEMSNNMWVELAKTNLSLPSPGDQETFLAGPPTPRSF